MGFGGFFAIGSSGRASRFVAHAKEPPAVKVAADTPVSINTVDVQVYVAPDARDVLHATGITEVAVKEAVEKGLARSHIGSVPDKCGGRRVGGWVSVRFSTAYSAIFASASSRWLGRRDALLQ